MKRGDLINKLMQSSDAKIFKTLNSILKYENIHFNFDMFFESTPTYKWDFNNPFTQEEESWLEPLVLKHVIPDFMMDNFGVLRREETKMTTDFVRVFFVRIFVLNLMFIIKKNQNLYLSDIKEYQYTIKTINNRKNIEYFFKFYFKHKVQIIENIPEKFRNFNQFQLGHTSLKSNLADCDVVIGSYVYTCLNKYHVILDVSFGELQKVEDCVWALTKNKILILKSNQHLQTKKRYYFCLVFVGTVLKGINALLSNEVPYAESYSRI